MNEDLFKKGLEKRKQVLGDDYVERNLIAADDFARPFQRHSFDYSRCRNILRGTPSTGLL